MDLWDHQKRALKKLHNGSVLVGGTGSGKSLTSLAYYKKVLEHKTPPRGLYIITTAKKRDDGDWQKEASKLDITELVVDSWNNIAKYKAVRNAIFIFDEQRVIGYGKWSRTFIRIAKFNRWILLSATPADTWMDLIPVFIANGFYRNKTEFLREHVDFAPYIKYPKIIGYRNEAKLTRFKNSVFVVMKDQRHTTRHISKIKVSYNEPLVKKVLATQWNPYTDAPIESLAEEVFTIRRIINESPTRILWLTEKLKEVKKMIIFYNFNFELEIMKGRFSTLTNVAEQNGRRHDPLPTGDTWVYLVQYLSGAEAWECFTTNHMAFYSLNYSYRIIHQARGRIDRHNTPYSDLYYWELVSDSILDVAIQNAFSNKKSFNIRMLNLPARKSQTL